MSRRRRSSRRSRLHGLGALDTGTMLIGAGVVVGLGTLAYYFMRDSEESAAEDTSSSTLSPYQKAAAQLPQAVTTFNTGTAQQGSQYAAGGAGAGRSTVFSNA